MAVNTENEVYLSLMASPDFTPLAMAFVEKAAFGLKLGQAEALSLTLATEEIFSYLCRVAMPDQPVEIRCSSGGYYVKADFIFSAEDFNMRAFNVTATVSFDDEASLEEMGLLIASRSVERFYVSEEKDNRMRLTLIKEKAYPEGISLDVPEVKPFMEFSIREPDPDELKLFVMLVKHYYQGQITPNAFKYPGKVVDMVDGGEYQGALAIGKGGEVGGGIIWRWSGLKTIECFGPYIFNQAYDSPMANDLLETCLGSIAKTHAVGLINLFPTHDLPGKYFEPLGTLKIFTSRDQSSSVTAYFRQMQEDPGTSVWSPPELEEFLQREYKRLFFPRQILPARDLGEMKSPFSVLSAEVDRSQDMVTLRPIRSGTDAYRNLSDHLSLFSRESIYNIFFEMDLGRPWESEFVPGLLKSGFKPKLVMPYAGKGDIVIFQLDREL
ncbi:MAG TPA: hypothetical protein PK874_14980 [Desulfobacteraceae bacterium]|nr:hypothetical protein [Desulfobacteraceae bacterium]HPJ69208.1 hypothetical protein [Desulfobacteraceae bacterium]HPQ27735.1 hypothetical protein [Desulfobacteraceae bacterium]